MADLTENKGIHQLGFADYLKKHKPDICNCSWPMYIHFGIVCTFKLIGLIILIIGIKNIAAPTGYCEDREGTCDGDTDCYHTDYNCQGKKANNKCSDYECDECLDYYYIESTGYARGDCFNFYSDSTGNGVAALVFGLLILAFTSIALILIKRNYINWKNGTRDSDYVRIDQEL